MSEKEEPESGGHEKHHGEQSADSAPDTASREPMERARRQTQSCPPARSDAKEGKPHGWSSMSWTDRAGFIFDVIVALATTITLGFLIAQWRQINAALGEAKEANRLTKIAQDKADRDGEVQDARNERLIKASEDSAKAAKDAALAASASAFAQLSQAQAAELASKRADSERVERAAAYERDQRASLTFDGMKWNTPVDGQKLSAILQVRNNGKTTALNFVQAFVIGTKDAQKPFSFNYPLIDMTLKTTGIDPNRTSVALPETSKVIPNGLTKLITDGLANVVVWGTIGYTDTFTHAHTRHICIEYNWKTMVLSYCAGHDQSD